jgi:Tol biopolymer transport system component
LTGQPVFGGETLSDTLAGVLKQEPNWQALSAETPAKVRDLLRRCLQKDKTLRMQAAGDARIEIQEALAAPATAEPAVAATARGFRSLGRHGLIIGLGVLVLCAAVTGLAVWNLKPAQSPPPRPVSRVSIDLPPGAQLAIRGLRFGVISPDGNRIVYVATQGGTQQLYLRAMDSLEARPIPGTEGAVGPFFSPDGQWVGFVAGGKLKKVSINGGAPITLCDVAGAGGASWSKQGTIVFGTFGPLMQVSDAGGTPQALTHVEKDEIGQFWPEFLPGGKSVLFTAAFPLRVAVYSLETGERHDLVQGATSPHYLPSGYLVYAQAGGNLLAVPFDAQRLRVTGAAVLVAQGVLINAADGVTQYSLSDTGSLVYASGGAEASRSALVWVDRKGVEQPLPAPPHAYRYPRLSPDGGRVAVAIEEGGDQIWLYDVRRDTLTRLTFEGAYNLTGAWTRDGQRIAFGSNKGGQVNVFLERADGSGGLERLTTSQDFQTPNSFSPDGQALAFTQITPKTRYDIWVLRMGDRKAEPFLQTPSAEGAPTFSPDGHWLAYVSNESGRNQIYVRPYPGPGGKYQISTAGGTEPIWNPKGGEMFYRQDNKMMAVEVTTQPKFSAGEPRMLFEGQYVPTPGTFPDYDVSADGQRFLMLKPAGQAQASTQINVVLNWTEELKRLVSQGTK